MTDKNKTEVSRRDVAKGIMLTGAMFLPGMAAARQVEKEIHELKPGEFTWNPGRSPIGPVAIVVSIPEQRVHVYRNGIRIAVSTCSTGKKGHETPTGVFTILQKDQNHRSSTYNNAPMPNMNRLTWSGIAMHAGRLPGYPASHGCVRLPLKFSAKLFTVTHLGTPVILSGSHTDPYELIHPGMVLGDVSQDELAGAVDKLKGRKHPSDWSRGDSHPITTMIVSSSDMKLELLENGQRLAQGALTIKGERTLGEHVFVLKGAGRNRRSMAWAGISHHVDPSHPHAREEALVDRILGDRAFVDVMQRHMHPGMMLIVTDLPLHPDRRSGEDFVIMTTG